MILLSNYETKLRYNLPGKSTCCAAEMITVACNTSCYTGQTWTVRP